MQDSNTAHAALTASALWTLAGCLILAAWGVAIFADGQIIWTGMIAATGIVISAVATAAQNKVYALRVCALVRATSGVEHGPTSGELRLMR